MTKQCYQAPYKRWCKDIFHKQNHTGHPLSEARCLFYYTWFFYGLLAQTSPTEPVGSHYPRLSGARKTKTCFPCLKGSILKQGQGLPFREINFAPSVMSLDLVYNYSFLYISPGYSGLFFYRDNDK